MTSNVETERRFNDLEISHPGALGHGRRAVTRGPAGDPPVPYSPGDDPTTWAISLSESGSMIT
jgi:hypothetical protein